MRTFSPRLGGRRRPFLAGAALLAALVAPRAAAAQHANYHGGPILRTPQMVNLYWNNAWDAHNPGLSRAALDAATQSLVTFDYFQCANQYGVHDARYLGGHEPAFPCGWNPAGVITGSSAVDFIDIGAWATCMVGAPFWGFPSWTGVPQPTDDSVYAIYLPAGIDIDNPGINHSCRGGDFDGYHFVSWVPKWKVTGGFLPIPYLDPTQRFAYAVVVTNCNPGSLHAATGIMSHEILEASTDVVPLGIPKLPHPGQPAAWFDDNLGPFDGEVSDLCMPPAQPFDMKRDLPDGTRVSSYWSNADGSCCNAATLALRQTGLPNGLLPAHATLDGDPVDLPIKVIAPVGTHHTYAFPPVVADPAPGVRWSLTGGPASGAVIVRDAVVESRGYKRELQLEVTTNPANPNLLAAAQASAPKLTKSGFYDAGAVAKVKTPKKVWSGDTCWVFDHWSGDAAGAALSVDVLMNAPKAVTAAFTAANPDVCFEQPFTEPNVPGSLLGLCLACGQWNDPGNVLIADALAHRVIEIDPRGNILWQLGGGALGPAAVVGASDARRIGDHTLIVAAGVAPGALAGFPDGVADNRVMIVDAHGSVLFQYGRFGLSGAGPNQLHRPVQASARANGNLIITDQGNERVIEVTQSGALVWQFGESGVAGSGAGHLSRPSSAEPLANGGVLIADGLNARVIEVDHEGLIAATFTAGSTTGEVAFATRTPGGTTLFTDVAHQRVVEVDALDHVVWSLDVSAPIGGTSAAAGSAAGPGAPARAVRRADGSTLVSAPRFGQAALISASGAVIAVYAAPGEEGLGAPSATTVHDEALTGEPDPEARAAAGCDALGHAYCERLEGCGHSLVGSLYGDAEICAQQIAAGCRAAANVTRRSAPQIEAAGHACAESMHTASCDDLVLGRLDPVCGGVVGDRLHDGAACSRDTHCESGFCATAEGASCGVCAPAPVAGAACTAGRCGPGLYCTNEGACAPLGGLGVACDTFHPCVPSLSCAGGGSTATGTTAPGVCSMPRGLGDPCDLRPQMAPACDALQGLACHPTALTCVHVELAHAGEPCGAAGGAIIQCAGGGRCLEVAPGASVCEPALALGAACDPSVGARCQLPSGAVTCN